MALDCNEEGGKIGEQEHASILSENDLQKTDLRER